MMKPNYMLVSDFETDGLLDTVTKIHCLTIYKFFPETLTFEFHGDYNTDEGTVRNGLVELWNFAHFGGDVVFHNGIKYDHPVLKKLHPDLAFPVERVIDTMVLSRLVYSSLDLVDSNLLKRGILPGKLFGQHSLKAWGYRLGELKGNYAAETEDAWAKYTPEMGMYCNQDVKVTCKLLAKIYEKQYSPTAIQLEHEAARLMAQQERNGFPFNETKAAGLYVELLEKREELERKLKESFGSWTVKLPDFVPKRDNKKMGYVKGVPVPRSKVIDFNPSSRDHIANRLTALYGWVPKDFSETGKPKIDDEVLSKLTYPEAPMLTEYLLVDKRIAQLAEGNQAWLKVSKQGKIHGSVNPNGAVTGRATHAYPNVAQVPSCAAPYGSQCRELFGADNVGWVQAGIDASGLELRCLAHFMGRWDDGAYGQVILNGDIHTENQKAAGLPTRNNAKTFIYAFLYGAGDEKIGSIVGGGKAEGSKLKRKFMQSLPALGSLVDTVKATARKQGFLKGLDGRKLHVRSEHSALNTLLQSAGALICKKWIVVLEQRMLALGYKHGWDGDFCYLAWVHDEVQLACRTHEIAEIAVREAQLAMKDTEAFFNFRCPLDTEGKIGANWKDCH